MLFGIVSFVIHPIWFTQDWWKSRPQRMDEAAEIAAAIEGRPQTRCPANYWGPGMGPCVCEGRVHPESRTDDE